MNEHNALSSNNNNEQIKHKITEERKRKSTDKMNGDGCPKQTRGNYYSPLDNDDECDSEVLKSFETHVHKLCNITIKTNIHNIVHLTN